MHQVMELDQGQPPAGPRLGRGDDPQQRRLADVHPRSRPPPAAPSPGPGSPARVTSVTGSDAWRHTTCTGSGSPCHASDVRRMSCRAITCSSTSVNWAQPLPRLERQHRRLQVDVVAAVPGQQVVEQHPFLQRGQRIDIGHVRRPALAPGHCRGDLLPIQVDQGQHVRGDLLPPRPGSGSAAPPPRWPRPPRRPGRPGSAPRTGPAPPPASPARAAARPAAPPAANARRGSKKSSSGPTASRPRTSANSAADDLLGHASAGPARTRAVRVVRRGQRLPVELAAGVQRQRVQHHHRGRHHVIRQPPAAYSPRPARPVPPRSAVGLGRDDVGDQPLTARGVLADDDRGPGHAGQAASTASTSPGSIRNPRILT